MQAITHSAVGYEKSASKAGSYKNTGVLRQPG